MNTGLLEDLRFQGYRPRTLLDIGAHIGTFTVEFLQSFPDCVPTLIEPNPHCQDDLARLPFERHAFAASAEAGSADMFLTKEWLQSTGSSLYRENTAFFRDEVVMQTPVQTARLDDVFAGRRFDFVKIDTQGAELNVLIGGRTVISQADYVLAEVSFVDFNAGGAAAEAVFAQLSSMGFRCAEAAEFHRLRGVENGALLQMDFLFERLRRRPTQNHRYAPLHGHGPTLAWLQDRKARCADFSVIALGGTSSPWTDDVADAVFGANPKAGAAQRFAGNLNDARGWETLLRHVSRHGRFAYALCPHLLQDLAYPAMALEMLPHIAEAGFISVPSRYLEALKPEGPYRGFIQHRWVMDAVDGELVLAPKIGLLEHLALGGEGAWPGSPERFELQMHWRGAIGFRLLNDDHLGPTRGDVIDHYARFLDRP